MEKTIIIESVEQITGFQYGNKYHTERLIELLKLRDQVAAFHPCILEKDLDRDIETLWLDKANRISLTKDYKGQYFVGSYKHYSNLDTYALAKIRDSVPAPKHFKVLSTKNFNAWIAYCLQVDALAKQQNEANGIKKIEYLAKLDAAVKSGGYNLQINESGSQGYLTSKELTLTFEINTNGYISERLHFNISENLENFIKLSK